MGKLSDIRRKSGLPFIIADCDDCDWYIESMGNTAEERADKYKNEHEQETGHTAEVFVIQSLEDRKKEREVTTEAIKEIEKILQNHKLNKTQQPQNRP